MNNKIERYVTPPSFEEVGFSDGKCPIDMQDVSKSRKEIWLIKAPANFDGSVLGGVTLNLDGDPSEFSGAVDEDDKKYEALCVEFPKENVAKSPYLLLPTQNGKALEPAPAFKGQITIMESLNLPPANQLPAIEASEAPEMPEGLRQRFQPYGWEEPRQGSDQLTCSSPRGLTQRRRRHKGDTDTIEHEVNSGQNVHDDSVAVAEMKTKTKKTKRKHDKEKAPEDDIASKQQATVTEQDFASSPKKKKKKKQRKE